MNLNGFNARRRLIEQAANELRAAGAWVVPLAFPGTAAELEGHPSLVVGVAGLTWLVNIAPDRLPTPEQRLWAKRWPGGDVLTVSTPSEALAAFGLLPKEHQDSDGHSNSPSASDPHRGVRNA